MLLLLVLKQNPQKCTQDPTIYCSIGIILRSTSFLLWKTPVGETCFEKVLHPDAGFLRTRSGSGNIISCTRLPGGRPECVGGG